MEFLVFSPLIKHCIESHCGRANVMLFGSLQILIKIFSYITLTCVGMWPVSLSFLALSLYEISIISIQIDTLFYFG